MSSPGNQDGARLAGGFQDRPGWYLGTSAYWFATSLKWFILLVAVLPAQVASVVPEDLKNTYWGRVFLIGAVWAVIGPALFGNLSDRLKVRRPFVAIGAGLTVIALAVLAQIQQTSTVAPQAVERLPYLILVIGYLLLQVSDDIGTGPYSAIVPDMVPEKRRGLASGILGMSRLFAQVIAGVLVFALGGHWTHLYIAIAAINVLCGAWTWWTLRYEAPIVRDNAPREPFFRAWLRPWASRDFRWVFTSSFLLALAFYLVQPYLLNYLHDVVRVFSLPGLNLGSSDPTSPRYSEGAATKATAIVALTISLFGAIGALTASRLTDKVGRKPVVFLSGALMFAALIPFALSQVYFAIVLLATVFGFGYGARISAEWALISDVLPTQGESGKDMGIWQMSQSSVQIVAGGSGALIDALNRGTPGFGYKVFFIVAAVLFGISTLLIRMVRGSK